MKYRDSMIIINRLKGVTTVPPNTEELREACGLAIEAMRKQIPMKPKKVEGFTINPKDEIDLWECPECEKEILGDTDRYCYNCGQALDWEEDYCGFRSDRKTIYDDLNCIDIAIGLERKNIGLNTGRGGHTVLWSRQKK